MDTHENCIAGAGAMGSRLGIMLHQGGNDVTLIDQYVVKPFVKMV